MPKIKLKSIDHHDLIYIIDRCYNGVDIKICDSINELFITDDRIPILSTSSLFTCMSELKQYLGNKANKFILIDILEGTPVTIPFLSENNLISFCESTQLQVITSGDLYSHWKYVNLDYYLLLTGSIFNQIVAVNNFENIYQPDIKPYKFLFLNKADREHREKLIELLGQRGLLESALWSDLSRQVTLPKKYADYFNQGITEISINQTAHDLSWPDGVLNMPLLTDTYFSVVTETNYDLPMREFTEKIYKTILAGHPFIAVSCKGYYRYLHQEGYQTFGEFIDESFDDIDDLDQRLEKIADEIQKLCNSDLVKFHQTVKEICRYNQQIYLEKLGKHTLTVYNKLNDFFENVDAKTN